MNHIKKRILTHVGLHLNQKLKDLIALNPSVLNGLTLENVKTKDGKDAIDAYVVALERKIKMQTLEAQLTDSIKRSQDAKSGTDTLSLWEETKAFVSGNINGAGNYATAAAKFVYKSPGSGASNFQVIAIGISDSCRT